MTNHPNRSRDNDAPGRNPTAAELLEFRMRHELSPVQAAALAFSTGRTWQHWESGERRMHPAIWQWVLHSAAKLDETARNGG